MEPFATVEEYRARYPDDEVPDGVLLEALLEATDLIASEMDMGGVDRSDPSEELAYRLRRVCRTAVHRAIGGGAGGGDADLPFGATQLSETADVFSASVRLANPYGDLFLTEQERRSLGIGAQLGAVLSPYG